MPLQDTFAAVEQLQREGKVLSWGVSNFDKPDLDEALEIAGEGQLICNQVLYHLEQRRKSGPGRPGWSPTQAPHRSGRARQCIRFLISGLRCAAQQAVDHTGRGKSGVSWEIRAG